MLGLKAFLQGKCYEFQPSSEFSSLYGVEVGAGAVEDG